jgi:hypothetical protein
MSCLLTDVSDAALTNLVTKYGAEAGLTEYINSTKVFKEILNNYSKEVSFAQQINIKKRIGDYNKQNNTSYYVNFNQVGQADLYTWNLENKRPPALFKPIEPIRFSYPYKIGVNQWVNEEGDVISEADALMTIGSNYSLDLEQPIKPGVEELFESNPELANIGTPKQYSEYLDTIFPDSKVKDIVYRGFNKDVKNSRTGNKIGIWFNSNKEIADGYTITHDNYSIQGKILYSLNYKNFKSYFNKEGKFVGNLEQAKKDFRNAIELMDEYFDKDDNNKIISLLEGYYEVGIESENNIQSVIINIENPTIIEGTSDVFETESKLKKENNDSFIVNNFEGANGNLKGINYVVFEPEQIHILGTKQDIEEFKQFVNNINTAEENESPIKKDVNYSLDLDFPFTEDSARKINEGIKSITVRPINLRSGTYIINNKYYNIKNYGFYNIEDYLDKTGQTIEEVRNNFIQDEEIKYEHIQKWFDGENQLYVYNIEPSNEKSVDVEETPYEKALKKLNSNLEAVKKQFNKEKNEDYKLILKDRIKAIQKRIKELSIEENQILPFLLQQAFEHIDEASAYLSNGTNGDIVLASHYLSTYLDLFPTENINPELLAQINLFKQKLSELATAISNAGKKVVTENAKLPIGGYVQEKEITSNVLSAATSNNPLVRYAHKKIIDAMNAIDLKKNFLLRKLKSHLKILGKINNPKEFFDWMLQKDENGELTGYTISRLNYKYIKDKYKYLPNFKEEVTNKQINNYLQFLKINHAVVIDRKAYSQYVEEKKAEIAKSNIIEGTRTLEDIISDKIAYMLAASNPDTFLSILNKNPKQRTDEELTFAKRFLAFTKRYVSFEVTNNDYLDQKYVELQNMDDNDPRKMFYNFYTETIKNLRLQDTTKDYHVALNYIPELAGEVAFLTKMQNTLYYDWSEIPEDKREYFEDPTTGEALMSIPDGNMLNKKLSAKNKSYDLAKVLEEFIKSSINKIEKEKIEDEIKVVMEVVKNQPEYKVVNGKIQFKDGKPQTSTPLTNNSFNQLKYFVESTLYDKRQEKEFAVSKERYDPELVKNFNEAKILLDQGEITPEEFKEIERQMLDSARVITGKKITNNLIKYTAIKALGLNFFSGVAEFFQSGSAIFIEAAGGRFFNDDDVKVGYSKIFPLLKDSEELQKWFDNFPLLNNYGYETPVGKWTDKAFWFFRQSEKIGKGALLFARLNAIKILDTNGNEHSLLNAIKFNENGEAYLEGPLGETFDVSFEAGSEFRNTVLNEVHALSRTLLARDNARDPVGMNKKALWRLVGQFRASWIFEGITRRFAGSYQSELGESKGYYNSVFLKNGRLDTKRAIQILLAAQFHPEKLKDFNIEGLDLENVRKALREFKIAASLTLIYVLAKLLANYDDDEDDWDDFIGSDVVINSVWRFNRDLTYFINPDSAVDILGNSPMASIATIKQGMDLMKAIGETAIGDPYLYEDTKRERLKILARTEPLIPLWYGVKGTYRKFTESE